MIQLTEQEKKDLELIVKTQTHELFEFPSLQSKLYQHFKTKMPYEIARAKDGDPDDWIIDKFVNLYNSGVSFDEALSMEN